MSQHIEIEFKNLLTQKEFHQIKKYFSIKDSLFIKQENHYFDTQTYTLKENHSALRIRFKNGKWELTLKQPAKDGLLETNQTLTKEEGSEMMKGKLFPDGVVKQCIQQMNIEPNNIIYFGSLITNRAEVLYQDGLLVLDHSLYENMEDYELEYEVKNAKTGLSIFYELLSTLQIPIRKTDNKIQRFYNAKYPQID